MKVYPKQYKINMDFEQELYKHFGQVKDFTLGMQIGKYFYELGCCRTAEKYDEIEYKRQRADVCERLEEEHLNPFKFVAGCIDDTLKEKAKEVSANEIEDEINRWMGSTDCLPEDVGITPLPKVMEIVERTARHFAQWGAEHLRPADGKKWIYEDEYKKDLERLFNDGKQEMREQMMKEAVEGTIVDAGFDDHTALVYIPDKRYDEGDKVRIIIVKED